MLNIDWTPRTYVSDKSRWIQYMVRDVSYAYSIDGKIRAYIYAVAAPQFWKWGYNFVSGASEKFLLFILHTRGDMKQNIAQFSLL